MFKKEEIISVSFSEKPDVRVRVIDFDNDSEDLIEEKTIYPFKLYNDIVVKIKTDKRYFEFKIVAPYEWNGADIPQFLWSIVGGSKDNRFLTPSMVHDYLLENKENIYYNILNKQIKVCQFRRLTSDIFGLLLTKCNVPKTKANIMTNAVDIYQTLSIRTWNI